MGPCGKNLRVTFRSYCPKTSRLPVISPALKKKKMSLLGKSRELQLWSATIVSHVQAPAQQGKNSLTERKRKLGGIIADKDTMAFH